MMWKGMNGKNDERMNEKGVVREDEMRERRKWIEEQNWDRMKEGRGQGVLR